MVSQIEAAFNANSVTFYFTENVFIIVTHAGNRAVLANYHEKVAPVIKPLEKYLN